jgi:hypothetical protein
MERGNDCEKKAGKCTWIAPQTHRHAHTAADLMTGPGSAPTGAADDQLVKQAMQ